MKKFVWSKMLAKPAELEPVRRLASRLEEIRLRQEALNRELDKLWRSTTDELCSANGFPRELTAVIDLNHMTEHGVAFIHSQEMEEVDAEPSTKRSVH